MIDLSIDHFDRNPFDGFEHLGDLLFYDRSILAHWIDNFGSNYLSLLVDYDEKVERRLLWRVNQSHFEDYLEGKMCLRDIIQSDINLYLVDVDYYGNYVFSWLVDESDSIPQDYIPNDKSFFK